MSEFIRWNSQPLDVWAEKYAQGQFVDLAGRRTHYIEKGAGHPVILLHGFFYDSYLWAANIDALAENFKVYVLDLWGFGYSTREPLDYGYQLYVDQVLLFMDSLGIERASLLGQSLGGGIAVAFSVQESHRVDKLLLVAPAGLPNPLPLTAKVFNLNGVDEFLLRLNTDAVRRMNLRDFWFHDKKLLTNSYFENVTRFHKVKGTSEAMLAILRKDFFDTLNPEIHRLAERKIPTLLVWGRQDSAIPLRCGQKIHRILQGCRLEIIDNTGHIPNFEDAQAFNQLAVDFLREPSPGRDAKGRIS